MSTATRTTSAAALCLLLLIAGTQPAVADDGEVVAIEVSSPTTVQDILRATSEQLDIQFIWGNDKSLSAPIQGSVAFRGTNETVFSQVRTLLLTYDLVLIRIARKTATQKETYRVADMRQSSVGISLRAEPISLSETNLETYEAEPWRYVTTTIHLEHARDLRNMRTALSRIVSGNAIGQITEVPDSGALMMTDFAPKVVAAYRMIKRMDVAPPEPTSGPRMTVIKIEHARAQELARLIETLLLRRPAKGQAASSAPRVVADNRTNQIVLSGEAGMVSQIESMIKQLDVKSLPRPVLAPRPPVTARVVRLNEMSAAEAADSLTLFVRGAGEIFDTRPTVVALRSTNALVIAGTERAHKVLGELIASLDVARDATEKGK